MDKNVEVLVVDDDLAAAQTFSELIATKYSKHPTPILVV